MLKPALHTGKLVLISALTVVLVLALLYLGLKGFFTYQQTEVCEPKAHTAVAEFIALVSETTYESMDNASMFVNEAAFSSFKSNISTEYHLQIMDWTIGVIPLIMLKFENGAVYGLTFASESELFPQCWSIKYRVIAVGGD